MVVADNLGSHMVAGVRHKIEARDAELRFLSPYSAELNPVENVWAYLCGNWSGPYFDRTPGVASRA